MSTTILTRSEQVLAKPLSRATALVRSDSPRPSRRTRRARKDGVRSTRPTARGVDVQARSVTMWPRTYR